MLQAAKPVKIIFGVHQGLKSAILMKAAWAMLIAASFLAFAF
jgi:hypothetical protein